MKKNDMDGARREEKYVQDFGGRNHVEDLGIDGDNIKMDIRKVGCSMDWIWLWLGTGKRAVVNAVMNLRV
jgi:hypothetical protein